MTRTTSRPVNPAPASSVARDAGTIGALGALGLLASTRREFSGLVTGLLLVPVSVALSLLGAASVPLPARAALGPPPRKRAPVPRAVVLAMPVALAMAAVLSQRDLGRWDRLLGAGGPFLDALRAGQPSTASQLAIGAFAAAAGAAVGVLRAIETRPWFALSGCLVPWLAFAPFDRGLPPVWSSVVVTIGAFVAIAVVFDGFTRTLGRALLLPLAVAMVVVVALTGVFSSSSSARLVIGQRTTVGAFDAGDSPLEAAAQRRQHPSNNRPITVLSPGTEADATLLDGSGLNSAPSNSTAGPELLLDHYDGWTWSSTAEWIRQDPTADLGTDAAAVRVGQGAGVAIPLPTTAEAVSIDGGRAFEGELLLDPDGTSVLVSSPLPAGAIIRLRATSAENARAASRDRVLDSQRALPPAVLHRLGEMTADLGLRALAEHERIDAIETLLSSIERDDERTARQGLHDLADIALGNAPASTEQLAALAAVLLRVGQIPSRVVVDLNASDVRAEAHLETGGWTAVDLGDDEPRSIPRTDPVPTTARPAPRATTPGATTDPPARPASTTSADPARVRQDPLPVGVDEIADRSVPRWVWVLAGLVGAGAALAAARQLRRHRRAGRPPIERVALAWEDIVRAWDLDRQPTDPAEPMVAPTIRNLAAGIVEIDLRRDEVRDGPPIEEPLQQLVDVVEAGCFGGVLLDEAQAGEAERLSSTIVAAAPRRDVRAVLR